MPMRRISSAVHSAQRFTSPACCGNALMLGIARYAFSSSTYRSRLVLMKSMTLFINRRLYLNSAELAFADENVGGPVKRVFLERDHRFARAFDADGARAKPPNQFELCLAQSGALVGAGTPAPI